MKALVIYAEEATAAARALADSLVVSERYDLIMCLAVE